MSEFPVPEALVGSSNLYLGNGETGKRVLNVLLKRSLCKWCNDVASSERETVPLGRFDQVVITFAILEYDLTQDLTREGYPSYDIHSSKD